MATDTAGEAGLVATERASPAPRVLRGAELVAVSERFYLGIFVGTLSFVALSTLTAAVFLPLRDSAVDGRPPLGAVAACVVVLLLTATAIWRAGDVYRMLLRRPNLQLLAVAVAALLLSVASPLRNELWWSSCAILMALATVVSLRRALGYCLAVLLANLVTHVVTGSIHDTSTVGVLGLWIGMPFWVATAAVIPDRMARHILRLNATRAGARAAPWRVGDVGAGEASTMDERHGGRIDTAPEIGEHAGVAAPDRTGHLTARQLQVVAMLAEGLRYREIAACLSISPGQVHRHVANAIARLGVQTASELVAMAVAEGVLPAAGPQVTEY